MSGKLPNPAIRAVELSKRYRSGVEAVRRVSLDVSPGEVFGLLGQNGAGKTTTVRMLVGLLKPTQGQATVCGIDVVTDPAAVRRRLGFAAQFASVDPLLSVRENLVLTARLRSIRRAEAHRRADGLIEKLELEEVASTRAAGLSGGMQRRVDLAQAIIGEPPVLFLDEPTVGLDPVSRRRLWDIVLELARSGTAVFVTTHYLEEADRVCDRVAIIAAGRIIATGAPGELKEGLGSQVVTVAIDGDADATGAARAAAELAAVSAKPPQAGSHSVVAPLARGCTLWDAVGVLHAADIAVTGLSVREPTLEEVYLQHTGAAVEPTGAAS